MKFIHCVSILVVAFLQAPPLSLAFQGLTTTPTTGRKRQSSPLPLARQNARRRRYYDDEDDYQDDDDDDGFDDDDDDDEEAYFRWRQQRRAARDDLGRDFRERKGLNVPSGFGRRDGWRLPESVSKALLAGVFVLGVGLGVTVDSQVNTNPKDLASCFF